MRTQKSTILKPKERERKWYLIDATDRIVGRLATEVASLLRGKKNPCFTPHTDSGDFVIVINASKVKFTGKKWEDKIYYWHTNHISGLKQRTAREQLEKAPQQIVMKAVKGMLPKNTLGRKQLTKLRVFPEEQHLHEAQKPLAYHF